MGRNCKPKNKTVEKKSAFQKFLTLLLREKEKLNTKASHRNREGSTEEKIQSRQELVMKYRK